MARRVSDLAARLRAAVEREEQSRSAQEDERRRAVEAAQAARRALFDDLEALGAELPFLRTHRDERGVVFERNGRELRFEAEGESGVTIGFTGRRPGSEHHLYREEALGGRWVWVRRYRGRDQRLPLFDRGLELLLVHALDLPDPDQSPEPGDAAVYNSSVVPEKRKL